MLKDLVRALSLANLCFIASWVGLLDTTYNIPSFNQYLSIIINVLLLALLLWFPIKLSGGVRDSLAVKSAQLFLALTLLVPLNGILRTLFPARILIIEFALIALAIAVLSLFDVEPWKGVLGRVPGTIALVLFPFFLITMGQTVWFLTRFTDKQPAPPVSRKAPGQRVLWLIFDEMDYEIAFSKRPPTLQLLELDRFRSQAIFAQNAYPPADHTMTSMPALLTGRLVSEADLVNPSKLMVRFSDAKAMVNWGSQPNLFSQARAVGLNSAAVGWYLPYSRMIGDSLTSCSWWDYEAVGLRESSFNQFASLVNTIPLVSLLATQAGVINDVEAKQRLERRNYLTTYQGVLNDAREAVANANFDLVLVHWPVPHPPGIFNRHEGVFDLESGTSYLDNFELVDRTLGELRRAMEAAGMWAATTVLISSDHWWRDDIWRFTPSWTREDEEVSRERNDHRVPFMLKLAGQKLGAEQTGEFNTILTHDLVLALLRGELTTAEAVEDWLGRYHAQERSSYPVYGSK